MMANVVKIPVFSLFFFTLLGFTSLQAQQDAAGQLYKTAQDQLFEAQDYPAAITTLQQIVKDYPTYPQIDGVKLNLGIALVFNGKFANALSILNSIVNPPTLDPIRDGALYFIAQAQAGIATALPPKDPGRQRALETAIAAYTKHLQTFPDSKSKEDSLYRRALMYYLLSNYKDASYADAEKDLQAILQTFPRSANQADYLYMLGSVYSSKAIGFHADKKPESEYTPVLNQALDAFGKIISANLNPVVSNNAHLQIGNLLTKLAATPDDYRKALAECRKVITKDGLLPLVDQRIKDINAARITALKANNTALSDDLDRQRIREQGRQVDLQNNPDAAVQAMVQMTDIYLRLKQFDESRALGRRALNFATDSQKQSLRYLSILTYALQGRVDKANAALDSYKKDFAGDPDAANANYLIGRALLELKEYQAAYDEFAACLKDNPKGPYADLSVLSQGSALVGLKKYDEASKILNDFITKNPQSPSRVEALQNLASAQYSLGKSDDAIQTYRTLSVLTTADPKVRAQSVFQIGGILLNAKRFDEAAKAFTDGLTQFPDSAVAAPSLLFIGYCQEMQKNTDAAAQTYQSVVTKYPQSTTAPNALSRLASLQFAQGKSDDMLATLNKLIATYPNSDDADVAYLKIAKYYQDQQDYANAAKNYRTAANLANNPRAPAAQLGLILVLQNAARSLGQYNALSDDEKKQWQDDVSQTEDAILFHLKNFANSAETGPVLQELVKLELLKASSGLIKDADLDAYFSALAQKFDDPALKARIQLAAAGIPYEKGDRARALTLFKSIIAANPDVILSADDDQRLGTALLGNKEFDSALKVFQQLAATYPKDPFAQANALYGQGAVYLAMSEATPAQAKELVSKADEFFGNLEKTAPWSDKLMEATYGKSLAAENRGDLDGATTGYLKIVTNPQSNSELKAKALFSYARILEKQGKLDPVQTKGDANALSNYLKVDDFYGDARPDLGAEGLWRAGQIYEKGNQAAQARQTYQALLKRYPQSTWAPQAQSRLSALPATPAPAP